MLASSATEKEPGSTLLNTLVLDSVASASSSSKKLPVASTSCVNVKSVESSGTVSLIIVIVPFLIMLVNVHVMLSSGFSTIDAVRPAIMVSCAWFSTQATEEL